MLPEPHSLCSADVCRDGGTYVVLFQDCAGDTFEIELPVITDNNLKRIGYKPPILKGYDPKIHGRVKETRQLSWQEGLELRTKLVRLLNINIGFGGKPCAEEMFELLLLKGAILK